MIEKLRGNHTALGLCFTIAAAVGSIALSWTISLDGDIFARMQGYQFDCGIDIFGALICAALCFGSMRQESDGASTFSILIVMVSAGFLVNMLFYFTTGVPGQQALNFVLVLLSKLIDLAMVYFFYRYVRITLKFKGKLADWTDRICPVLVVLEALLMLSNVFYPVTFFVDANTQYQDTAIAFAEEIFLITMSIITTILIARSDSPRNQRVAALTFIFLPITNYLASFGRFADATNYGMILVSLVIMYCIIFNYNSTILSATQAELNTAAEIQTNMVPSVFPKGKTFDLYACMHTAKEVGGDFYDSFMIDEDRLCVVIADVSGKGMPAALFMMTATTMIKDHALVRSTTSEIFTAVNARLCEHNEEGMFVTAWIGILDIKTMTLRFTNAGHNYPVLQRKGQPCEFVNPVHGLFLAGLDFTEYRQGEIELEPGDRLFLYTDGVTEAHDQMNSLYGEDRLIELLESTRDASGEHVLESIFDDISVFSRGVPQFDDITMVVLTIKEQKEGNNETDD